MCSWIGILYCIARSNNTDEFRKYKVEWKKPPPQKCAHSAVHVRFKKIDKATPWPRDQNGVYSWGRGSACKVLAMFYFLFWVLVPYLGLIHETVSLSTHYFLNNTNRLLDNFPRQDIDAVIRGKKIYPGQAKPVYWSVACSVFKNVLMYVYNRFYIRINNKSKQNQAILISLKINSARNIMSDLGWVTKGWFSWRLKAFGFWETPIRYIVSRGDVLNKEQTGDWLTLYAVCISDNL